MPIHQTKLIMANPQPTGSLTNQRPMPVKTRVVIVSSINWNRMNEIVKPTNHQTGVLRFRTIELILSVTDANVSPGATTGAVVWCIGSSLFDSSGIRGTTSKVSSSKFQVSSLASGS